VIRDLIENIAGYPGLFLICVVSGLGVPLPEDFALIYAGARIASAEYAWTPVLLVTVAGVLVRDLGAWGIGHVFGVRLLQWRWTRRFLSASRLDRATAMVEKNPATAILTGRFLIGFRAPVFMVAGATGVGLRTFVVWDVLGLLVAVPGTILLGYIFGAPIADGVFWALQRARLTVVLLTAAALMWFGFRWWRRHRAATSVSSTGEFLLPGK
jgi:membrane protein DedA with SNARE-associated domain